MTNQPIKILIVEDTMEHAQLLQHILGASNYPRYTTVCAHTLAQATERLRAGGIDAVLLDLTLPDSMPNQTFRAVNQVAPDIAVVIISGLSDVSMAAELVHEGAQDYLIKGQVDHNLLLRSLHYSIERKRAQVALRQARDQLEARVNERTLALVETNTKLQSEIAERKKAQESALGSNRKLTATLEELHAAQQEIVNRERLNALGQMANGIAHEFNNVLTPILAWTEHLIKNPHELKDYGATLDTIEKIHAAATVGAAAVGRAQEFSRTEATSYGPVDLSEIVGQAISLTEPTWKIAARAAGVMIEVRNRFLPMPDVVGDAAQLRELVSTLILNAARAIPRRGAISISAGTRDNFVGLTVRDDGQGMNKLTLEKCLDPNLGTSHSDGSTTGFGVIHGILQRHNGKLEIESLEGRGSKVTVLLPIATGSDAVAAEAPLKANDVHEPEPASGGRHILIAEDDSMVREVMNVYLVDEGFEVTMASNGREALDIFSQGKGRFNLIITDRAMPEMNGDQFAIEAKRVNPKVPVILLTGFGELMISEGVKPEGVDLVVGKPFTMSSLREALAKVGF